MYTHFFFANISLIKCKNMVYHYSISSLFDTRKVNVSFIYDIFIMNGKEYDKMVLPYREQNFGDAIYIRFSGICFY